KVLVGTGSSISPSRHCVDLNLSRFLAALICLLSVLTQGCRERHELHYSSLADAIEAGQVQRGWLPDFLPPSSYEIHLTYAAESARTWCAFRFSPNDTQSFKAKLTPVTTPPSRVQDIAD